MKSFLSEIFTLEEMNACERESPQMFLAVTKWHYIGQFAVMTHKIFTLEEMNACEREMSANVPRGHEMAL